jgi:hypothetical protein
MTEERHNFSKAKPGHPETGPCVPLNHAMARWSRHLVEDLLRMSDDHAKETPAAVRCEKAARLQEKRIIAVEVLERKPAA